MKILIIEDEPRAASSLEKMIMKLNPVATVIGKCPTISSSVSFLQGGGQPDLIFMDIQLADGLSFEIFTQVVVKSPVIFCTAFDEYSIQAFKQNGIDYILKPFSSDDIERALAKVDQLSKFYQQKVTPDFGELIARLSAPAGKTSFLVFHQQKYITVPTENIAFFHIQHNTTCIMCFDRKEYVIHPSLDQVATEVSEKQFFRVNRQYLLNFKAISQVEPFFMRKLYVKLVFETKEKILVNKEKAPKLLAWLEHR